MCAMVSLIDSFHAPRRETGSREFAECLLRKAIRNPRQLQSKMNKSYSRTPKFVHLGFFTLFIIIELLEFFVVKNSKYYSSTK